MPLLCVSYDDVCLVRDDFRQGFGLHDPGFNHLERRQLAYQLLLRVDFVHLLMQIFRLALCQFRHGIDACDFQQLAVLAADALDTVHIGEVNPAQQLGLVLVLC